MKISRQFFFAKQLIKAHFFQYALAIFGIFIGTASVFFFLSLTQGIKDGVQQNFSTTENILTVSPSPQNNISAFFQKKLDTHTQQEISEIEGVKTVYSEISLMIPSTITLPIPLMGDMMLDSYFIRGVDDRFFKDFASVPENNTHVILSPLALDFLNSFADSIPGFPGIKKSHLEKKSFEVEFGKSIFLPLMNKEKSQNSRLFVSGFSPMAPLLGIMIPQSKAEELSEFFGNKQSHFSRLHVLIHDDSKTTEISDTIRDFGFLVESTKEGSEKVTETLNMLQGVFLVSSGLILLISILFLFSLLTLSVLEHHKTIGILRSLGASQSVVRNIFIIQGGIISFLGSGLGMIFGYIAIVTGDTIAKTKLPPMSIFPESLFSTSPLLIGGLFSGIIIVTLISIIIPANTAAKKDPLLLLLE